MEACSIEVVVTVEHCLFISNLIVYLSKHNVIHRHSFISSKVKRLV